MPCIKPSIWNAGISISAFIMELTEFISDREGYLKIATTQNETLKDGGKDEAASKLQRGLEDLEKTELHIAVTGEAGAGKSSFINAIRGLSAEDAAAAPVGVTETTLEPEAYSHPNYPAVIFWDLPGIGSTGFPSESYPEKVNLSRYDFFIIVGSRRFQSSHIDLAQEIQWMEKKFYFVRSKVDLELSNIKKAYPKKYNEEQVLKQIKDNCKKHLLYFKDSNLQSFLISSKDLDKYDFSDLVETLQNDLPSLKRLAFLLSLPNLSPEIIAKNKANVKKDLWKISLVSTRVNVIPIPGAPLACDVSLLLLSIAAFYKKFELDDDSLARLASWAEKPLEDLNAVIKSPRATEITRDLIVKKYVEYGNRVAREIESDIPPVINTMATMLLSFSTMKLILSDFLDNVAEDAERVRNKVLEQLVCEA